MGNLVVEADPVFGGGHFRTSGIGVSGGTFEFIIDDVEISVVSAGDVYLSRNSMHCFLPGQDSSFHASFSFL